MQLVGYECRPQVPLHLIPLHNWLVNNLAPALPKTGPEKSPVSLQMLGWSCFFSLFLPHLSGTDALHKTHSLAATAIFMLQTHILLAQPAKL